MSAAPDHELSEIYPYPVPPAEGWMAEDLDRLPGLPRRTELIDGTLVFMSPQTKFHMRTMRLLEHSLLRQAPDGLDVFREFSVKLDSRNRPEPDVLVVPAGADTGPKESCLQPHDVILAVEVVSEEPRQGTARPSLVSTLPQAWSTSGASSRAPTVFPSCTSTNWTPH